MNIISEVELIFSKRKILTMGLQFEETHFSQRYFNFSQKNQEEMKSSQSMGVLLITTKEATRKLNQFSEFLNLNLSINLVLFIAKDYSFQEDCTEFGKNFKFSFHQLILVKCYGNKNIRAWHSVHGNETKTIFNWGLWEPHKKLIIRRRDSIYASWGDLKGKILRIATVKVL